MKVLIADLDLFFTIGGGQTFYRAIIERNPEIEFTYLRQKEPADAARPANARAVPCQQIYWAGRLKPTLPPLFHQLYEEFLMAMNIAVSVAGQSFDAVDLPDYRQYGTLLGPALRHHGAIAGKVVLSMHGVISRSIELQWPEAAYTDETVRLVREKEALQYAAVDLRYGISRDYIEQWHAETGIEALYLDPMHFLSPPRPVDAAGNGRPTFQFVGRKEKRKGPDIFIDLAWWLGKGAYGNLRLIGDPVQVGSTDSEQILRTMAARRHLPAEVEPAMTPGELLRLFGAEGVTCLPSRWDTLNLVALESLFAGCPTAIGSGAGACRFLDDAFPGVPYIKIDMERPTRCLAELARVLRQPGSERRRLIDALAASRKRIETPGLREVYEASPSGDAQARTQANDWFTRMVTFQEVSVRNRPGRLRFRTGRAIQKLVPNLRRPEIGVGDYKRLILYAGRETLRHFVPGDSALLAQLGRTASLASDYDGLFHMPEETDEQLKVKLAQAHNLIPLIRLDRARLFREIARLEQKRGNELLAAVYRFRVMRWLGADRFGDVPAVAQGFSRNGFAREAEAAQAMFGGSRARELLDRGLRDTQLRVCPFERFEDRRSRVEPLVSVIVSLYNAAEKLPLFLRNLALQTLHAIGRMEIILVDSGSPADEFSAWQKVQAELELPVLYVRTHCRETIQQAWNNGLSLARAPYVAFLGVDEADRPDALRMLADELEADPNLDWVQGSSFITCVSPSGALERDLMCYDRPSTLPEAHYLDCTYLYYVGGLYRKSIHDRVGYYDGTFRAAGDTEFKNRALPFITSKTLPERLGVFLNYPDDRATHSPAAEIEDTRAWYLHRTLEGVRYAFQRKPDAAISGLLRLALCYRKCYLPHLSSDVEYAHHLLTHLRERDPVHPDLEFLPAVGALRDTYRRLQLLDTIEPHYSFAEALRLLRNVRGAERKVRKAGRKLAVPEFEARFVLFNDNQFEQHHWPWSLV